MRPFTFVRPSAADEAVRAVAGDREAVLLAGGTNLVDHLRPPIDEAGHQQARRLAVMLGPQMPRAIVASPLLGATQTAQPVADLNVIGASSRALALSRAPCADTRPRQR